VAQYASPPPYATQVQRGLKTISGRRSENWTGHVSGGSAAILPLPGKKGERKIP
jgi:hypothetical protein